MAKSKKPISQQSSKEPQIIMLQRLQKELQTIQQAWQQTKNQLAQNKEAEEALQSRKSQLEGQSSAVKRTIANLRDAFGMPAPKQKPKVVKKKSKKKKK